MKPLTAPVFPVLPTQMLSLSDLPSDKNISFSYNTSFSAILPALCPLLFYHMQIPTAYDSMPALCLTPQAADTNPLSPHILCHKPPRIFASLFDATKPPVYISYIPSTPPQFQNISAHFSVHRQGMPQNIFQQFQNGKSAENSFP